MATVTAMPHLTEPPDPGGTDLLVLHQLFSPAFPVGGFAWSQGLETAIAGGQLRDAASLTLWVRAVLEHGAGRGDAILLAHARRPQADLAALDDLARALAPSPERLAETLEQGAAFAALAGRLLGQSLPALAYPLVAGRATRGLRLPTATVLGFWLQTLAAQLVSAAVRFVPLGQSEGQQVLHALAPEITALATFCATAPLSAIASFTPGADLASMQHETMEVRIFRS